MKYFLKNGKTIGKLLLVMYAVTALLLFVLALLVQKIHLESGGISVGISVVYVISCFLGGFFIGKVQKTKKFLWGLFMGVVYVLVMVLLTLIAKGGMGVAFSAFWGNLLLCLGGGMLGGMLS